MKFHSHAQEKAYKTAMKREYKAVAFDIDGTLTKFARFIIPDSLQKAIAQIPSNVATTLCTGRSVESAMRRMRHVCHLGAANGATNGGANGGHKNSGRKFWYIISENGGAIHSYNCVTGKLKMIHEIPWPEKEIPKATLGAFLKDKFGWHVTIRVNEYTTVLVYHKWVYLFPKLTRALSGRSFKQTKRLIQEMKLEKTLTVLDSGVGVVIRPTSSGKGKAIRILAKHLKIPEKSILAIGDQPGPGENDEEFLSGDYGTPFTVGGMTKNTYPLPVLSQEGKRRLTGPPATEQLLKQVLFAEGSL